MKPVKKVEMYCTDVGTFSPNPVCTKCVSLSILVATSPLPKSSKKLISCVKVAFKNLSLILLEANSAVICQMTMYP